MSVKRIAKDALWLAITPDEYELPFCVGDTAADLAIHLTSLTGKEITRAQVIQKAYHYRHRKNHSLAYDKKVQYKVVEVEMDGYEEM